MSLNIKIEVDFSETLKAFEKLKSKEIANATRAGLNRTAISVRQFAMDEIRKKIKVKESSLRNQHIRLIKAGGASIEGMSSALLFSNDPIPMLEFVRGSKDVIQQKGVPVSRRRKIRVEITPGKRFVLKRAFIQRKISKQVFKGRRGEGFKKQGIRSVGYMITNRGIGERIVEIGGEKLRREIIAQLDARIKGIV